MTKPKTLEVIKSENQTADQALAEMATTPNFHNGVLVHLFAKNLLVGDDLDLTSVIKSLTESTLKVKNGNLSDMELMLMGQAQALQSMFTTLTRRAEATKVIREIEMYMGMAFKAQSQCRSTLQALTELKYPRQATFVKQANISHGHQQINNEVEPHAQKIEFQQNELLEGGINGDSKLDTRSKTKTSYRD
jgi:hypothetical protein